MATETNTFDIDSGLAIMDAIMNLSDSGKAMLSGISVSFNEEGYYFFGTFDLDRGPRSCARALIRRGLLVERGGLLELTDLGRAVAAATAEQGAELAGDANEAAAEIAMGC